MKNTKKKSKTTPKNKNPKCVHRVAASKTKTKTKPVVGLNVLNRYFRSVDKLRIPSVDTDSTVDDIDIYSLLDDIQRTSSLRDRVALVKSFVRKIARHGGYMLPNNFSFRLQQLIELQRKSTSPLVIHYSGKEFGEHVFDIIEVQGKIIQTGEDKVAIKPSRGGRSVKIPVVPVNVSGNRSVKIPVVPVNVSGNRSQDTRSINLDSIEKEFPEVFNWKSK